MVKKYGDNTEDFKDPAAFFDDVEALRQASRLENQVRARVQALLSNAGLPEVGVAHEVMYWMPSEFTEWYAQLFLASVKLDGRGKARGPKDGEDNVKGGVTGALKKKKGETAEEYQMRAAGRPDGGKIAVKTTGKKYKVAWTVKDEKALKLKERVDRALVQAALEGKDLVKALGVVLEKEVDANRGVVGKIMEREGGKVHGSHAGRYCRECGKAMRSDWRRCPFHDA